MTAWLFLALVIAAAVALVMLSWLDAKSKPDRQSYQAMVDLHAIRRRSEVSQFKTELRRDAAHLRRVLRDELDGRERRRP
jgi:hypothetical protein